MVYTEHPREQNLGVHPASPTAPLAGPQHPLTHISLPPKPSSNKLWEKGQREPLLSPAGGSSVRGQVPVPGAAAQGPPRRWGQLSRAFPSTAGSCFTQKHRALRGFGKSLFSPQRRARVSVLKTRTKKTHWLVLPACAAGAARPPPPLRAARLLWMPNLQDFQAWLKYFSVIWCRGRSRLKLTQIYSSLPG